MTKRTNDTMEQLAKKNETLKRLAQEARVELTPEVRAFAWLVTNDALQNFWQAAKRYAEYEKEKAELFLKDKR